MDTVLIRGLEVSACHGVRPFEKVTPQKFIFDVDICCDFYAAAEDDDLSKTVNYSLACDVIVEFCKGHTFDLIEKLAYSCAFLLLDSFPSANKVKLSLYKPQAPVKQKISTVGVAVEVNRERAFLSLGSSLGDKRAYLDEGIKKLEKTAGIKVKKVSSYIETQPYGGVAKNKFLNCAAEIETYLTPRNLLNEIHRIELECGRERKERWGDRTLDIDIIFFGRQQISEEGLEIPHPEYLKRDFVLKPLKEIAGGFICPNLNKKLSDL